MSEWCDYINSVVSPGKASILWCFLSNAVGNVDLPSTCLNGQAIKRKETFKYLIVTFACRLLYRYNVKSTVIR